MENWDGKERRHTMFDQDFYDKMIEMHANMKHMVEWSKKHDDKDDERFDKVNSDMSWTKKYIYMGLGGLAVLQVFVSFFK